MPWWGWLILNIYVFGVGAVFFAHIACLPMVTPGLAALRAIVWPIFWLTGWPAGRPLPMD